MSMFTCALKNLHFGIDRYYITALIFFKNDNSSLSKIITLITVLITAAIVILHARRIVENNSIIFVLDICHTYDVEHIYSLCDIVSTFSS